jgi:hypothetical protein
LACFQLPTFFAVLLKQGFRKFFSAFWKALWEKLGMRATNRRVKHQGCASLGWEDKGWIGRELDGAYFQDVRLGKRLRALLGLMSNGLGQTIPLACQDWANTKAAYRFFSNPRINEEEILIGHFASTQARAGTIQDPLLVLHDTTEFSFQSNGPRVGLIWNLPRKRTVSGLLMNSSLVVAVEGLPLGLAAVKFWTRKHFKGTNALKRIVNPTRIPIEEKGGFQMAGKYPPSHRFAPAGRPSHSRRRPGRRHI